MTSLEIITGPMFSGKSEKLISILCKERLAGKKILVVKPADDSRTTHEIVARTKDAESKNFKKSASFPAKTVGSEDQLSELLDANEYDVLAIDEAQFFNYWLLDFIKKYKLNKNKKDLRIIITGLDLDAWGRTFGSMGDLMALANSVKKLTAVCFVCKRKATYTQRKGPSRKQIEVGDNEAYEARCEQCFKPIS